ncbi:LRRCT domain-containing protein [Caerostris extrusa]|uniref:LRRCT domain-containing protein n=1 Tax=Caerostris extrusa TaxID=172846 RepID=A0AAV4V4R8_CAEEX|nr:LRRCT domain-containing protein [Caerostris extrusa]
MDLATVYQRGGLMDNSLEWLKLGVNRLEEIPSQSLRNLSRLRQLDLRGNNISKVREDDFMPYGKNLKFIYLQNNWLLSIDNIAFVYLDSLEWLHLQSNQLSTFPYETYSPILNTLQVFDIHDNPIHCDCKIAWLRDWVQNKGASVMKLSQETRCETPDDFQSMPLGTSPTTSSSASRRHPREPRSPLSPPPLARTVAPPLLTVEIYSYKKGRQRKTRFRNFENLFENLQQKI